MIRRQLPALSPVDLSTVLASGFRAVIGPERVRSKLAAYLVDRFAADAVCLTGSGTQALQLALEMARAQTSGVGAVALPAYSCYDLVSAAVGARARIAFYDVEPSTLSFEASSLRRSIRAGARTVVAANLFGYPLDWATLRDLAEQEDLLLIEDASQGLGGSWRSAPTGTLGDMTVLSFGRGKGWTGGAGGALLFRGRAVRAALGPGGRTTADRLGAPGVMESVRALVGTVALWSLGRPWLYWIPASLPGTGLGETVYKEPAPLKRIPAYSAACAGGLAERSRKAVDRRRDCAVRWADIVTEAADGGAFACGPLDGGKSGYLRFAACFESEAARARVVREAAPFGVWGGYPRLLPDLEPARERSLCAGPFPGAERLQATVVTLPTHAMVGDRDFAGVRGAWMGRG